MYTCWRLKANERGTADLIGVPSQNINQHTGGARLSKGAKEKMQQFNNGIWEGREVGDESHAGEMATNAAN